MGGRMKYYIKEDVPLQILNNFGFYRYHEHDNNLYKDFLKQRIELVVDGDTREITMWKLIKGTIPLDEFYIFDLLNAKLVNKIEE